MNWEMLTPFGQLAAVVIGIPSLIYLALQIRAQTQERRHLTGKYAGTGNHIRISGYELWKINSVGLIAESSGHFDAAAYERQLKGSDG